MEFHYNQQLYNKHDTCTHFKEIKTNPVIYFLTTLLPSCIAVTCVTVTGLVVLPFTFNCNTFLLVRQGKAVKFICTEPWTCCYKLRARFTNSLRPHKPSLGVKIFQNYSKCPSRTNSNDIVVNRTKCA